MTRSIILSVAVQWPCTPNSCIMTRSIILSVVRWWHSIHLNAIMADTSNTLNFQRYRYCCKRIVLDRWGISLDDHVGGEGVGHGTEATGLLA